MKQTDWKIIYSSYEGIKKKAVHFLSREAGKLIIREPNRYRIYVLPCEKEGCEVPKNAFFVGLYSESRTIKKYVEKSEVPEDGFLVKVVKNPDDDEGRFVILTANCEQELFYAAVSFVDDYIPGHTEESCSNFRQDLIFDKPLPICSYTETPDFKTRSIFTWGHSISDYRQYIDNMARLKLNELVLWNDFIPVNISDIIEYAHSYGIKVILGYSWGWKEIKNTTETITDEDINNVKELAIKQYKEEYVLTGCDGIYFQSFTERTQESVGGRLIADMVTDMVNEVAEQLWRVTPDLRLIFGLHVSSVSKRLDIISRVDPRIEFLCEDIGEFPYGYHTHICDDEKYTETIDVTKNLLNLREGKGMGLVYKGVMMLDWTDFVNQRGPYIMGENSPEISRHDRIMRAKGWRWISAEWTKNGKVALDMIRFIRESKREDVNMCIAGTFDGGIYLPFALCAQMFRKSDESFDEILKKVSRRDFVTVD